MYNQFDEKRFKNLLLERGISQAHIAKEMDLSRNIINQWANGKKKPSKEHLSELANLLSVYPEYLTGEEEFQNREDEIRTVTNNTKQLALFGLRLCAECGYRVIGVAERDCEDSIHFKHSSYSALKNDPAFFIDYAPDYIFFEKQYSNAYAVTKVMNARILFRYGFLMFDTLKLGFENLSNHVLVERDYADIFDDLRELPETGAEDFCNMFREAVFTDKER